VNRELEQAARTAWAAMSDARSQIQRMVDQMAGVRVEPMTAPIALDYVQNVTGDRDDAVSALIRAGTDWLDAQRQPSEGGEVGDGCMCDARLVIYFVRGELLGTAEVFLGHIEERCSRAVHPQATPQDRHAATGWHRWADKARSVIERCRLIVAAAYPDEQQEAA
jgi:hypothetical protein